MAVPDTCGMCHSEVVEQYRASVHGKALAKGITQAPLCTDCHGEHKIMKHTNAASPVNNANIRDTCGSCHGDIDHTLASPWLKGEPAAYLTAQLNAFLTGSRTNDINGQMRAMVHGMTPAEMAAAAAYYSGTASP